MSLLHKGLENEIQYSVSNKKPCIACFTGNQANYLLIRMEGRERKNFCKLCMPCGPFSEASWSGVRCIFLIIDDYSCKTFCYCLKYKDEVTEAFKEFQTWVSNEKNKNKLNFRSNNVTEFINSENDKIFKD